MNLNDLILLLVVFGSAFLAVIFQDLWVILQPYPVYFMMFLLFLSFMKIDFGVLLDTSPRAMLGLGKLVLLKLIILPVALYWLCLWILPDYAVPVLLLSGISTGVVAPFMATLLGAEVSQVARMSVVTSVLVPTSLPGLVKLLVGAEISIPFGLMVRMLAMVIFIPVIAVLVMRKLLPRSLSDWELKSSIISHRFFHEPAAMVRFGAAERETGRNSSPRRLAKRPDLVFIARPEPILSRRRAF